MQQNDLSSLLKLIVSSVHLVYPILSKIKLSTFDGASKNWIKFIYLFHWSNHEFLLYLRKFYYFQITLHCSHNSILRCIWKNKKLQASLKESTNMIWESHESSLLLWKYIFKSAIDHKQILHHIKRIHW